ncbi:MAG: hypothetical protein JSV89_02125 [Spirochaetaceae bacterium]|nr:MAG: hypothetical protein JSV89_02125 [Spirochaetaceae bacterium]
MSPYEVVRKAIEFDAPERLPVRFDELGISDIHFLGWNQFRPYESSYSETADDEWGCVWTRTSVKNMGQVKGHPLAEIGAIDHYRWPDPDNPRFYAGMDRMLPGSNDKYVLTGIFMLLFERIHSLRGFENTMVDLLERPKLFNRIADNVEAFGIGVIKNLADRFGNTIHGFTFTDDWGTERGLLIHPEMWRRVFKPRYKSIFSAIHECGWHVWMHSCGKINDIMDDLIDIGVDVINLQQPQVLGIEETGRKFRGRISFETLCDIQKTLPRGNEDDIRLEARQLIDCWAAPTGGFILSDYGDGEAIGVAAEKKRLMLEVFQKMDPWKTRHT